MIILTEVNVDEETCEMFTLEGFHRYQACREGRKGGGIVMFIIDNYLTNQLNIIITQAELLVVEVIRRLQLQFVLFIGLLI